MGAARAETFRSVTIAPYTGLLMKGDGFHRGGPAWPDWDAQTFARHHVRGGAIDTEPEPSTPAANWTGAFAWGGPLVNHFGHQIADFSTRLLETALNWPTATIAFATHPEMAISSPTQQPFFASLLHWYGILPERTRLVTQPVTVESLAVVAQAEQVEGPGPSYEHLDRLTALAHRQLGPSRRQGTVYVSRANYPGRIAGELYIEELLRDSGVTVVRPETLSLIDQLRLYRSADLLIFAEGSAIHGAQLLGRDLGDVAVVTRRPGRRIAEASIRPRSRSLRYFDVVRALLHDLDMPGNPAIYWGLALVDGDRLLQALEDIGLPLRGKWEGRRFAEARDRDVREWIDRERRSPRWNVPGSVELARTTLAAGGLSPDMTTESDSAAGAPETRVLRPRDARG